MFVEHKESVEVTEAPAKVMKLSEAMRIGAKIRPQCSTLFFMDGKSCAIGAAMEATGWATQASMSRGDVNAIEFLAKRIRPPHELGRMASEIYMRNDAGLSRESIADWLETLGL